MKKLFIGLMLGVTFFSMTAVLEARGSDWKRDRESPPTHSYQGESNRDYNHYRKNRNHFKLEKRILKKIRKNERRIAKLERKIQKLIRKHHHRRGYERRHDYSRKIHHLEREINNLKRKNHHLRQMLHQ